MRYLILFLFCSPCFAGPFAEVSLSARQQLSQLPNQTWRIHDENVSIPTWRTYDVNVTKNPYASVMIGYDWQIKPKFELGLAIRHESSIATGMDRGINDIRLSLRWHE